MYIQTKVIVIQQQSTVHFTTDRDFSVQVTNVWIMDFFIFSGHLLTCLVLLAEHPPTLSPCTCFPSCNPLLTCSRTSFQLYSCRFSCIYSVQLESLPLICTCTCTRIVFVTPITSVSFTPVCSVTLNQLLSNTVFWIFPLKLVCLFLPGKHHSGRLNLNTGLLPLLFLLSLVLLEHISVTVCLLSFTSV